MTVPQQLYAVTSLQIIINRQFPPSLDIQATGEAVSTGFTEIRLEPFLYTTPPADGIYEFSLTGVAPFEEQVPGNTSVAASYYWESFPEDLRGIRVHADSNNIENVLFPVIAETSGLY